MKSRLLPTVMVGLVGAIIGSFSMMLFASTHFAGVAGPNNTPPSLAAAPLSYASGGGSDQDRIVSAVKRVAPSVVALNVTVNGQQRVPQDPFQQFFGGGTPGGNQFRQFQAKASGSGFVYSREGMIVTNAHVVRGPGGAQVSKLEVVFQNGDHVPAHVFSMNVGADLALVKVDGYAKLPPPVEIADSNKVQAGQWAIAIGEPFELKQTVTVGVVSGFNRDETIGDESGGAQEFKGLLQTSAPINPGNSGGPLIDIQGRLIGVNQSTASAASGAQGIGFAIPASFAKDTLSSLERNPGTHQGTNLGYIGASLATVTPGVRVQLNYKGDGVAVAGVVQNSPADAAGLLPGDVILRVNGTAVTKSEDAVGAIKATKPGQTLNMEVWSAGVKKLISIKVEERPASIQAVIPQQQQQQQDPFGQQQQPQQEPANP